MFDRVYLPLVVTTVRLLHYPARWILLGTLGGLEAVAKRFR